MKNKMITRRFWITAGMIGPAATVDVRTASAVSETQAEMNAIDVFQRKLKRKAVFSQRTQYKPEQKPNFSIGPMVSV